ncbi:uncharacterized protein BYT42DRAFT_559018 [Radiomyces spectabilis]|uniref:uncharacterized protein n=1 Tax=Radiomyces spectabilis TaxID=64574 RepID=UPI00221EAF0C|nr:uncharacterized protein BYT42DRAFT_559018 [Radiomyces spectabilis]KAI8388123.1 hypothetical protein BYT42DRAFT_559018 [Radiomyces spectabilis]
METIQTFTQQTNLATLLGVHLGLSLFGALASNPTYNIPVFFFGIWAYNFRDSNAPLKTFTGVLALSILLDVVWFILHGHNPAQESGFVFVMIMNIISLLVKPISVFAAINTLQSRGDTFNAGSWSDAPGAFPGAYQPVRDGDEAFA